MGREPIEGEAVEASPPSEDCPHDCPEGSWIAAELRYFRSAPKRGALAQRLGRIPVLHVFITTNDGLNQAIEFVGVHQRRYYAEDPPTDAISKNLTESLLRVALEFIFHPSRSRYTKQRLILRESSIDAEALHSRADLLPRMVEKVRQSNDQIKDICLEFCDSRLSASRDSTNRRDKSYLVLDEDVLKVSPTKDLAQSSAPPAAGSFRGLGQGFLNSEKAKKRGLSDIKHAANSEKADRTSSSSSSSSGGPPSRPPATTWLGQIPEAERTRFNPEPAEPAQPPGVRTDREEKHKLLLAAAEPSPGEAAAQAIARSLLMPSTASSSGANIDEEEEFDNGQDSNLSDLANQLFGSMIVDDDEPQSEHTATTALPSPRAASSRDDYGSEATLPEAAAPSSSAPVSGIRLLQQQRRRNSGSNRPADPPANESASSTADEGNDLVALWMKQRW